MNGFLAALGFLTILPVGSRHADAANLRSASASFPVVGLLLGLALAAVGGLLTAADPGTLLPEIVVVITLAILTGGLHLDGLADTVDALASGKDRARMLEIMRDPHIGTMGVISIVSALLLKVALIGAIGQALRPGALIVMCVVSRWSLVFSMALFPYARQEGKAKPFTDGMRPSMLVIASTITLLAVYAASRVSGLVVLPAVVVSSHVVNRFVVSRLGGITGDTLGAVNEIQEIVALAAICIFQKAVA